METKEQTVVTIPPKEESKTVKRAAEPDSGMPARKTLPERAPLDSSISDSTLQAISGPSLLERMYSKQRDFQTQSVGCQGYL